MKTLFATAFAAMLTLMALGAHAAPLTSSTAWFADAHSPLPADDDKDKEKDKKDG
jgi:Spy/CpxP family protein refolding chaperone